MVVRRTIKKNFAFQLTLCILMVLSGVVRAFLQMPSPLVKGRPGTMLPFTPNKFENKRAPALWIKGQMDDDKIMSESFSMEEAANVPQEAVKKYFADQGVDERQLNLLFNLAFITVVTAAVLAKVVTVDLDYWRGWTPLEIFFRIPLDNWDSYMSMLTDHPVIVKGITSCSVYTLGDWVAQMYEGKSLGDIDRVRVARSAIAGLIGHGPLSHVWYGISEGFFDLLGWEGWWTVIPKITVDQLVWSPIWNGCYILLLGLMKREAFSDILYTVRSTAVSLITSGLKLWPLAHIVTYGLIPVENRLLWVDLVEILWVTILSREAAGAEAAEHAVQNTEVTTPLAAAAPVALPVVEEQGSLLDSNKTSMMDASSSDVPPSLSPSSMMMDESGPSGGQNKM